ncbi:DUF6468 domain-containing protein [Sneathiella chinensis]|uniref:DUF6468 domain-containing protein n=1 Tax=Sneathiella chinensis TaxID=349750 RepID=A0ABQ5U5G1_9PROT|nr:DUF6468 domain-containing protein [Sneathiella chinensis]GLQ07397.1 hypothetical protein GCM10007924_26180 [Sneathiella chinensis]
MMDMISVPLILDVLLICLLGATIGYCARLHKKLSVMRDAQSELHKVAREFDQATTRSRLAVEEMKIASKEAGKDLQGELDAARTLIEELKLINASGQRIADRLQEGVGVASQTLKADEDELVLDPSAELVRDKRMEKQARKMAETLAEKRETPFSDGSAKRSEAEKELLQMLSRKNGNG